MSSSLLKSSVSILTLFNINNVTHDTVQALVLKFHKASPNPRGSADEIRAHLASVRQQHGLVGSNGATQIEMAAAQQQLRHGVQNLRHDGIAQAPVPHGFPQRSASVVTPQVSGWHDVLRPSIYDDALKNADVDYTSYQNASWISTICCCKPFCDFGIQTMQLIIHIPMKLIAKVPCYFAWPQNMATGPAYNITPPPQGLNALYYTKVVEAVSEAGVTQDTFEKAVSIRSICCCGICVDMGIKVVQAIVHIPLMLFASVPMKFAWPQDFVRNVV